MEKKRENPLADANDLWHTGHTTDFDKGFDVVEQYIVW